MRRCSNHSPSLTGVLIRAEQRQVGRFPIGETALAVRSVLAPAAGEGLAQPAVRGAATRKFGALCIAPFNIAVSLVARHVVEGIAEKEHCASRQGPTVRANGVTKAGHTSGRELQNIFG